MITAFGIWTINAIDNGFVEVKLEKRDDGVYANGEKAKMQFCVDYLKFSFTMLGNVNEYYISNGYNHTDGSNPHMRIEEIHKQLS